VEWQTIDGRFVPFNLLEPVRKCDLVLTARGPTRWSRFSVRRDLSGMEKGLRLAGADAAVARAAGLKNLESPSRRDGRLCFIALQ